MKLFKHIILGSLVALSLTGCKSLYGKYERPQVKTSGIMRDPISATDTLAVADTTSFGNLPWREVFTDAHLQGLIEKALTNNPNLLNAALNVDMAQAQLKAAKLAFLPQFAFTPQGTITQFNDVTTKSYTLPVNASWNVSLFGGLTASKRSAQMALLQSKDYQVSVRTSLIAGVANLYYTLLMLDKQMQIVANMERLTKETWDIMKIQHENIAGVRSTAVQRAESNYYSVLTQKKDLERSIRESENALSLLLGEPAQTIARGDMDNQQLPSTFSTGIGIQLLRNRADVHANEMALAMCFYDIEKARSNFYPNITISATGGFSNGQGNCYSLRWERLPNLYLCADSLLLHYVSLTTVTSRLSTHGSRAFCRQVLRLATHWFAIIHLQRRAILKLSRLKCSKRTSKTPVPLWPVRAARIWRLSRPRVACSIHSLRKWLTTSQKCRLS